jgi:hypothetical protein
MNVGPYHRAVTPRSSASCTLGKREASPAHLALLERRHEDAVRSARQQAGEVRLARATRRHASIVKRLAFGPP